MFTILGASGKTGAAAAEALRKQGVPVRCIVRDSAKAESLRAKGYEVVVADVRDADALTTAFRSSSGVYVMLPPVPNAGDVLAEFGPIIDSIGHALTTAKPDRVVALSSIGAERERGTGPILSVHHLEKVVRQTGLPCTFVRPAPFMENWGAVLHPVQIDGVLPSFHQPLDVPVRMVSTTDIGQQVAECLIDSKPGERVVNLEGPARYSPEDVAATFARLMKRSVTAVAPPRETWVPALMASGLGQDYARLLAEMYDGFNAGQIGVEAETGELCRGRTTLEQALSRLVGNLA